MLSYAFRVLKENNYKYIESEKFDNIYDLMAEILYKGTSQQLKQGLKKDYIERNDDLSIIKGRIRFNKSISLFVQKKKLINCEYDMYSEDTFMNQIIKTTLINLIGEELINFRRRKQLKEIMPYLDNVSLIDLSSIEWKKIQFNRNNQNYKMLITICYFIFKNYLLTESSGKYKALMFSDEQMNLVFQNFILNYYKDYIRINKIDGRVEARRIKNTIDESKENYGIEFLPEMQSDIMIDVNDKTLIIDTKYYNSILSTNFEKKRLHSSNIYQIHDYVMHESYINKNEVSGMLLYAKTDEEISPSEKGYDKSLRHWFYVETVDLNVDFPDIKIQLNKIFDSILLVGAK